MTRRFYVRSDEALPFGMTRDFGSECAEAAERTDYKWPTAGFRLTSSERAAAVQPAGNPSRCQIASVGSAWFIV